MSIVKEANNRKSQLSKANDFKAIPGQGVEGVVNGQRYRVGRLEWVEELKLQFPLALQKELQESKSRGASAIVLMDSQQVCFDSGCFILDESKVDCLRNVIWLTFSFIEARSRLALNQKHLQS